MRAFKASGAGLVAVNELRELLGGIAAQGIDVDLAVLAGDELEEDLAVFIDGLGRGAHLHSLDGGGCAGGDRVADSLDLDDTHAAAAEGVEALVVAERRDVPRAAAGDLVDRFPRREGNLHAVEDHLVGASLFCHVVYLSSRRLLELPSDVLREIF